MFRITSLLALLSLGIRCFAQSTYDAGPSKDPRAVFAAIAPYYDFMDANLKPWHLKVNYQLKDENGNPSGKGVFEYWWASQKVFRSTWTRGNATHSEWHTADGKTFTQAKGEPLSVYEYWLRSAFVSPLPTAADLDPANSILVDHSVASSNAHARCLMVVPSEIKEHDARALPFGTYPEYCVNKARPILLGYYFFGSFLIKCVEFTEMQGKSMPRQVFMIEHGHGILEATIEPVEMINPTDPALATPSDATAINADKTQISRDAGSALVVKRVAPTFAADSAKIAHDQGKVVLRATIGTDGGVQDVRLVSAQAPSLALPAFLSVSNWKFKPYRVDGLPITAETTVEVDFPGKE